MSEIKEKYQNVQTLKNEEDWSPRSNWKRMKPYLMDMLIAAVISLLFFKLIFNLSIVLLKRNAVSVIRCNKRTVCFSDIEITGFSCHYTPYVCALILSHISYNIERGDIIVFKNEERGTLVKRVIGIPGDTIEIIDSTVYRNGEALNEDYINEGRYESGDLSGEVIVEDGTYFVLGDNRPKSFDSRMDVVGLVNENKIIGKYLIRIFPFR